jgi:tetratricopeptide (TPR) repeat protein
MRSGASCRHSPACLGAVGWDELILGCWEAARRHLEHAARLDHRSGTAADQLGQLLLYARQYPEAERAFDHALQLLAANLLVRVDRATVPLAQGNLARAQAVINAAPKEVDPTALVAFVANYTDLMWVRNEAQQRLLLRLTPSAFDDDRAIWGIVLVQTYALQGNMAKARVYADSSLLARQRQLEAFP